MTRRQLEKLGQAEGLLFDLHQQLKGSYGHAEEAKRLGSILGKLNNLKTMKGPKRDGDII